MSAVIDVDEVFVIHPSSGGGTAALQGLSLHVGAGEIVVIAGPSGAGKSTLLRLLAAFDRPSAGTVSVGGDAIGLFDARRADRYRATTLGILDQHYARSLSPDLTCAQAVALQLDLAGAASAASRARALELLERVGLADRADSRPGSLSGGEQQRVAVCAAVVHRPRLLLADEPAGELDNENAEIVYRLLAELVRETGATAVVVSHDLAAESIADRLVRIRDGRVVEETRPGSAPQLVVGRGGWVRIPELLLREIGLPARLAVERRDDAIALTGDGGRSVPEPIDAPVSGTHQAVAVAKARGIAKRFGERPVLSGFDFDAVAGRLTALVGRSGSGKTTLLHILAGLELPDEGEVLLGGESLAGRSRDDLAELRRRHVALITQEPGLVPYLTALENVELALRLRGAREPAAGPSTSALDELGLSSRLHTPAARLSAGERQRVAIARALAANVRLLLADEPTARLDEANARSVGRLLAVVSESRGLAVVVATHDPALVESAGVVVELGPKRK